MEKTSIIIGTLIDSLVQKKKLLTELLDYTKKQRKILVKKPFDYDEFNNIMDNKQVRIDSLKILDDGFVESFSRVSALMKNNKKLYRDDIKKMQDLIKQINDISVNLRMNEDRNKGLFEQNKKLLQEGVKNLRNHSQALKNYSNNLPNDSSESYGLFDSKK